MTGMPRVPRLRREATVVPVPLYSPRAACRSAVTPALTPPSKSRARKRGVISLLMMLEATESGMAPFQSVSDLDAHFAIVAKNKEDRAIVLPLLARLPGVGSAERKILERRVLRQLREDRDEDLA